MAGREPVSLYQDSRPSAPWPAAPPVSPEPGSGADVRATRGQHLSAAQSGQQMSASPPCHPRGPGVLDGPGPHPRPRPSAGRPILRPLSLLGRKSTFSFFPLPLHFLPSHLPSSLALLFLFLTSLLSGNLTPTSKSPQPLKFSHFMAWSQTS